MTVARLTPGDASFAAVCMFLSGHAVFAATPFGQLARVVMGQIRSGTHAAAVQAKRIVGYGGYLPVDPLSAERWLAGTGELAVDRSGRSRALALSVFAVGDPRHVAPIVRALRLANPGATFYFQRGQAGAGNLRRAKVRNRLAAAPVD